MPQMTKFRASVMTPVVLSVFAGSALGVTPKDLLDRTPGDTASIWLVKDPAALEKKMTALVPDDAGMEEEISFIDEIDKLKGLDFSGGMVFAMMPGAMGMDPMGMAGLAAGGGADPNNLVASLAEMPGVLLVGIGDRDAWPADDDGDGVMSITVMDLPMHVRDLGGGIAGVSSNAGLLAEFVAKPGQLDAHMALLGESGKAWFDGTDAVIISNIAPVRETLVAQYAEAQQQMDMMAAFLGPDIAAAMGLMTEIQMTATKSSDSWAMGITLGEENVSLDMTGVLIEGSELDVAMSDAGRSADAMNRLPDGPFLVAMSAGMGEGKMREMLGGWLGKLGAGEGRAGLIPGMDIGGIVGDSDGFSMVIGESPALMGAGLFANAAMYFSAPDAGDLEKTLIDGIEDANGKKSAGMAIASSVDASANVANAEVKTYTVALTPDDAGQQGGGFGMMGGAMMTQMMFGMAGGPNGFIAKTDSGITMTMAKNTPMLENAIRAAKNGNGLGWNDAIKSAREMLPENTMFEMYVSADRIANTIGPIAVMFQQADRFDPVDRMPPIAIGGSALDNEFQLRVVMPNDALELMSMLEDLGGGMGGLPGLPGMGPGGMPGGGAPGGNRPRF